MVLSRPAMTIWPALACTVVLGGCGPFPTGGGSTAAVPSASGQASAHERDRRQDEFADDARTLVAGQAPPVSAPALSMALPEGMTVVVIQGFFAKLPGMDVPPSAAWALRVEQ